MVKKRICQLVLFLANKILPKCQWFKDLSTYLYILNDKSTWAVWNFEKFVTYLYIILHTDEKPLLVDLSGSYQIKRNRLTNPEMQKTRFEKKTTYLVFIRQ